MAYLEGEPIVVVKEFEASGDKEADDVFDIWWDTDVNQEREN
jgi:hypothetical protein